MTTRPLMTVNVFSEGVFDGNPVAVVLDGHGLTHDEMLAFTRWTNLSETTFVVPATDPAADYRVRIFTPDREMPFAGHPTLGTCRAWLATGGRPRAGSLAVQECDAGLIPVRIDPDGLLSFKAPALIRSGAVAADDLARSAAILGIDPAAVVDAQWADNGPGWVAILLDSADAVLALNPTADGDRFDIGVAGLHPRGSETSLEVRAFFTDDRGALREDPVTGSLNASVAQWLLRTGRLTAPYVASQGRCIGRRGRVHVTSDERDHVWVGGHATVVGTGTVEI